MAKLSGKIVKIKKKKNQVFCDLVLYVVKGEGDESYVEDLEKKNIQLDLNKSNQNLKDGDMIKVNYIDGVVNRIELDQKRSERFKKLCEKMRREMMRARPWINFVVINDNKNNISGDYVILWVDSAYNEFYEDKANAIMDIETDPKNELDKVPHIIPFYEFLTTKENFKNLKKGTIGRFREKWDEKLSCRIREFENLNIDVKKTNQILKNIDDYIGKYHFNYSVESLNLDIILMEKK